VLRNDDLVDRGILCCGLMSFAHRWLFRRGRRWFPAEAGEAGEFEGEELLVDPDVAAIAAFGVVAEAEVEGVAAGVADGGVGVGDRVAADMAGDGGFGSHASLMVRVPHHERKEVWFDGAALWARHILRDWSNQCHGCLAPTLTRGGGRPASYETLRTNGKGRPSWRDGLPCLGRSDFARVVLPLPET